MEEPLQKKEPDKLEPIHTLTGKQQAFLKLWSASGFTKDSMVSCAMRAGYTLASARSMTGYFRSYDSPMRRAILEAMKKADFTIDKTVAEHKRLTFEAMHPFRPNQPDNEVRRKSVGMAYDIFDVKPPKKIEVGKADQVEVELDLDDVTRIEEYTGENLVEGELVKEENESYSDEDMEPL